MLNAGKTRAGAAGVGLAIIVGLSSAMVEPAAADTPNQKSVMAARAAAAPANVASLDASTRPTMAKAKFRSTSPSGAIVGLDGAPKADLTAAQPPTSSVAARAVEQPKSGASFIAAARGAGPEASRPLEHLKASASATTAAPSDAVLHPIAIAAARENVALRPAAASAPAHLAMLTPFSATATAKSATRELLRSKAEVSALHKARHGAASHQR
jgi:hypothetical protein